MRIKKRQELEDVGSDLTPMIDMTFQLIAFFMVLVNFSETQQDQRVKLPSSQLAKPPEVAFENPLTIQLTSSGNAIFEGEEIPLEGVKSYLLTRRQVLDRRGVSASGATVIIRADGDARAGRVQRLVQICRETRFEKFALRAIQERATP